MIFSGTKVRLTDQQFPELSFLPFLKMGATLSFFPVTRELHLTAMTFQI